MKRFLQKSLFRLHSLLLLLVMSVVGVSAAWAESFQFDLSDGWSSGNGGQTKTQNGITVTFNGSRDNDRINIHNSGSGWFKITSDVATITKVEMECLAWRGSSPSNEYAVTVCEWDGEASGYQHVSVGGFTTNGAKAIWEGTPTTTLLFTSTGDIDIRNLVVYYEPLPSVDYSFTVTSDHALPAEFTPSVMVDGDPISENTYSTPKSLTASNITATTPDGWYYEVAADDEHEHAFVVTYKEYLHYNVTVTGCSDASAGVRYNSRTYKTGDKIQVKTALDVNDLEVVHVNGYVEGTPSASAFDGYNTTLTIPYTEADLKDYSVTISGMPAGASVKVEEQVFDQNGTFIHQSRKDLSSNDASVQNCPATHYTNDSYQWYNSENKTFSITFTPFIVYTVAVDANSAYTADEAGVKVKYGNTYHVGETIYVKNDLTIENVEAAEVDGYTGTVTLAGNEFTVSYTKNEYILFNANTDPYYDGVNYNVTKDDVTLTAWEKGPSFRVNSDGYYPLTLTSTGAPIVKVELQYVWSGGDVVDGCNTGSFNSDMNVWTGSTNSLRIWDTNDRSVEVSSIKVWLAQPIDYTIDLVNAVAGCSVVVNGDPEHGTFTADGTYTTLDELTLSNIAANCPETHYAEKAYNAETHTFTITFKELEAYTVTVAGTTDTHAGVKYDGTKYANNGTIRVPSTLTASSVTALEIDGYDVAPVQLNDHEFVVTYTPNVDYVQFVFTDYGYGNSQVIEKDVAGVTVNAKAYYDHLNLYHQDPNPLTMTVATTVEGKSIKRIELFERDGSNVTCDVTGGTGELLNNVWTGDASSVLFSPKNYQDFYISKIRVYLGTASVYDIEAASVDPANNTEVESLSTITLTMNEEFVADSPANVPAGITLQNANHENVAIESVVYEEGSADVVITLANTVYVPGNYTLTVSQGVFAFADFHYNAEMNFGWTVSVPSFPAQDKNYTIKSVTEDKYLNVIYPAAALTETIEELSFEWDNTKVGFVIKSSNTELGKDNNSFVATGYGDETLYWIAEPQNDGTYALHCKYGYLAKSGSSIVCNGASAYKFAIEESTVEKGEPAHLVGRDSQTGNWYGTYYADYAWKTTGAFVYTIDAVNDGVVNMVLQDPGSVIPANTGVLLLGNAEGEVVIEKADPADAISVGTNLLEGSVTAQRFDDAAYKYYVLNYNNNEDKKLGFYWANGTGGAYVDCAAYKAFLRVPVSSGDSNGFTFRFDEGGLTGIDAIATEGAEAIYNLQGQRVNATKAGVYVKNGKKFIVK